MIRPAAVTDVLAIRFIVLFVAALSGTYFLRIYSDCPRPQSKEMCAAISCHLKWAFRLPNALGQWTLWG